LIGLYPYRTRLFRRSKELAFRLWIPEREGLEKRSKESLSTTPGVVNELKKAEVDWELLLRNASMGTQPGT
jgi:hypothetical protein